EVVRRKRLLHELHAVLFQDGQHLERAVPRPAGVRIHSVRLVGGVADRAQDLLVALRAQLDLENRICRRLGHLLAHLFSGVPSEPVSRAHTRRESYAPARAIANGCFDLRVTTEVVRFSGIETSGLKVTPVPAHARARPPRADRAGSRLQAGPPPATARPARATRESRSRCRRVRA